MANEEFGPLAPLIGTWKGDQGVNVSYDYDKKEDQLNFTMATEVDVLDLKKVSKALCKDK